MSRWVIKDGAERPILEPKPVLRLSTSIIRDTAWAGTGVALFPSFFVRKDIAASRLACWDRLAGESLKFWALHASSRFDSSKVRAFIDMLGEVLSST